MIHFGVSNRIYRLYKILRTQSFLENDWEVFRFVMFQHCFRKSHHR